jgi:hypothetical protein
MVLAHEFALLLAAGALFGGTESSGNAAVPAA